MAICFSAFAGAGQETKEKFATTTNEIVITFPPTVNGGQRLTISSPKIVIQDSLKARLGGSEIADLVRPPLENLLNSSGRFSVLLEGEGPYRVITTLTDLMISQAGSKKEGSATKFFKGLGSKIINVNGEALTADWSKDETKMTVQCGMTVQLVDRVENRLIAGTTGFVRRENTTAAIRAELAGITYGSGATRDADGKLNLPNVEVNYQSRLMELAAFDGLKKLIPAIDQELTQMKAAPKTSVALASAPAKSAPAENQSSPPENSSLAFCGKCGTKPGEGDNFCTKCGNQLRK